MNQEEKEQLINNIKEFFRNQIVPSHLNGACERASKLKEYNVHPFLLKYLANFLEGDTTPRSIAKALIYPRILGTSITTIFGNQVQKMIAELFEGFGSAIPGIDIEFIDAIDNRRKYCQLKSGPNTINKDDVQTIHGHFNSVRNIARVNHLDIALNDLIIGVIYGKPENLSNHYKKLNENYNYPLYIGQDFWHRLTGDEDFYQHLIAAIGEVVLEVDGRKRLEATIATLAADIEENIHNYL